MTTVFDGSLSPTTSSADVPYALHDAPQVLELTSPSPSSATSKPKSLWHRLIRLGPWVAVLLLTVLVALFIYYGVKGDNNSKGNVVKVAIFAFNDVYEIKPVGIYGGLARVKTYKSQVEKEFPDGVISVLAGDLFSPSALGTAPLVLPDRTTTLSGKQMVAVLNKVGVDVCTFGNHEFDIKAQDFIDRLNESAFPYVATNVWSNTGATAGQRFPNTVPYLFLTRKGIRFAFVSVIIDVNKGKNDYADIKSFTEGAALVKQTLADWHAQGEKWDVLVAVTHLNLEDDVRLAELVPEIDLVLGGHEHQNWYINRGTANHPFIISKADSNVKTIFTHRIAFHKDKIVDKSGFGTAALNPGVLELRSELYTIDSTVADDVEVLKEVEQWWHQAAEAFKASANMDINKDMCALTISLDARDRVTRHNTFHTFGDFFTGALFDALVEDMKKANMVGVLPEPQFFLFNGGSVRIDDVLEPGPLSEYDVLRIIPYPGRMLLVQAKGKDINAALALARSKPGNGGWAMLNSKQMNCGSSTSDPCKYIAPDTKELVAFEDETLYTFGTSDWLGRDGGDDLFPVGKTSLQVLYEASLSQQIALREAFKAQFPLSDQVQVLRRKVPSVHFSV